MDFFYITTTKNIQVNSTDPYTKLDAYVDHAIEYPRIFTDNIENFGQYFTGNDLHVKALLNHNFCSRLATLKDLPPTDIALYICNTFSAKTAQEGILSFWYYEIYQIRSMAMELIGKKNSATFEADKLNYWRKQEYIELRMTHYEVNRYFIEIIDEFFIHT
jgi:hypothetical protein